MQEQAVFLKKCWIAEVGTFCLVIVPTELYLHLLETSLLSNKLTWQAARFPGAAMLKQLYNLGCKGRVLCICAASSCRNASSLKVLGTLTLFPAPPHKPWKCLEESWWELWLSDSITSWNYSSRLWAVWQMPSHQGLHVLFQLGTR